jgi:hypothetical protein
VRVFERVFENLSRLNGILLLVILDCPRHAASVT